MLHLFLRIMGLLFHQAELFVLSKSFHTLHKFEIELLCVSYFKHFFKIIELVINKKRTKILETELERIGVPFKFYKVQCEDGPSKTQWTRLDGNILCIIYLKIVKLKHSFINIYM